MTDPETPVDVLAAALLEVDSVGGPGLWGDEDTAIAILAAMPDHTIVSKDELANLRALAELVAMATFDVSVSAATVMLANTRTLHTVLARLTPEPLK